MTYSSRRALISFGLGRVVSCCCSSIRSSAMMSRQMSTHSSLMKTVGPAMSFLTSRWLLLQNEHLRTSSPLSFFGISPPLGGRLHRGCVSMLGAIYTPVNSRHLEQGAQSRLFPARPPRVAARPALLTKALLH